MGKNQFTHEYSQEQYQLGENTAESHLIDEELTDTWRQINDQYRSIEENWMEFDSAKRYLQITIAPKASDDSDVDNNCSSFQYQMGPDMISVVLSTKGIFKMVTKVMNLNPWYWGVSIVDIWEAASRNEWKDSRPDKDNGSCLIDQVMDLVRGKYDESENFSVEPVNSFLPVESTGMAMEEPKEFVEKELESLFFEPENLFFEPEKFVEDEPGNPLFEPEKFVEDEPENPFFEPEKLIEEEAIEPIVALEELETEKADELFAKQEDFAEEVPTKFVADPDVFGTEKSVRPAIEPEELIEKEPFSEKIDSAEKNTTAVSENKKEKGKKKVGVLIAFLLLLTVAVVAAYIFFIYIPNTKYNEAMACFNQGQYEKAAALFNAMDGYKDSEDMAVWSRYETAVVLQALKKYPEAIEAFEALDDYKDSKDRADQCRYEIADGLLKEQKFEDAIKAFEAMSGFKDSKDRADQCRYEIAGKLQTQKRYPEAIEAFEALGDYKDSEDRVFQNKYSYAKKMIDKRETRNAIPILEEIRTYEDAEDLLKQCRDTLTETCRENVVRLISNGSLEKAKEEFKNYEDYVDLPAFDTFVREQAASYEKKNNYQQAFLLYQGMGDKDSAKRCNDAYVKIKKAGLYSGTVKYTSFLSNNGGEKAGTPKASDYITMKGLSYTFDGNDTVTLTVKFDSTIRSEFDVFNPPDGDIYMKFNPVSVGSNSVNFTLSLKEIIKGKNMTILFYKGCRGGLSVDMSAFTNLQTQPKDLYGNIIKK